MAHTVFGFACARKGRFCTLERGARLLARGALEDVLARGARSLCAPQESVAMGDDLRARGVAVHCGGKVDACGVRPRAGVGEGRGVAHRRGDTGGATRHPPPPLAGRTTHTYAHALQRAHPAAEGPDWGCGSEAGFCTIPRLHVRSHTSLRPLPPPPTRTGPLCRRVPTPVSAPGMVRSRSVLGCARRRAR